MEAILFRPVGGDSTTKGTAFEHDISSFCLIHAYLHEALPPFGNISNRAPIRISMETGGPGDDLLIAFDDGIEAECQLKSGEISNPKIKEIISNSFDALRGNLNLHVVVVVGATASGTVHSLGRALDRHRIKTAHESDDALNSLLGHCEDASALLKRAHIVRMEEGDPQRHALLVTHLRRAGLQADECDQAIAIARNACEKWRMERRAEITADLLEGLWVNAGLKPIPPQLNPVISIHSVQCSRLEAIRPVGHPDIQVPRRVSLPPKRLESSDSDEETPGSDWEWLKQSRTAIVTGDPGSGKTDWIARGILAADGQMRIVVRAQEVAQMISSGKALPVEAAMSPICGWAPDAIQASIRNQSGILFIDGIDEIGESANDVLHKMHEWAGQHRRWTVALVGRPGISQLELPPWRRFRLGPPSSEEAEEMHRSLCKAAALADARDADELEGNLADALKLVKKDVRTFPLTACSVLAHIRRGGTPLASYQDVIESMMNVYIESICKTDGHGAADAADTLLPVLGLYRHYTRLAIDGGESLPRFARRLLGNGVLSNAHDANQAIDDLIGRAARVGLLDLQTIQFTHQSLEDYLAAQGSCHLGEEELCKWVAAQASIYGQGDPLGFISGEMIKPPIFETLVDEFVENDNLHAIESLASLSLYEPIPPAARVAWTRVLNALSSNNASRTTRIIKAASRACSVINSIDENELSLPTDSTSPHDILATSILLAWLGRPKQAIEHLNPHRDAVVHTAIHGGGPFSSSESRLILEFLISLLKGPGLDEHRESIQEMATALAPGLEQLAMGPYVELYQHARAAEIQMPNFLRDALNIMPNFDHLEFVASVVYPFTMMSGYDAVEPGGSNDAHFAFDAGLHLFGDTTGSELVDKTPPSGTDCERLTRLICRRFGGSNINEKRVLRGTALIAKAIQGDCDFQYDAARDRPAIQEVDTPLSAADIRDLLASIAKGPAAARHLATRDLDRHRPEITDNLEDDLRDLYRQTDSAEALRIFTILASIHDTNLLQELVKIRLGGTLTHIEAGVFQGMRRAAPWNRSWMEKGLTSGIETVQLAVLQCARRSSPGEVDVLQPFIEPLIEEAMHATRDCERCETKFSAWHETCPEPHSSTVDKRPGRHSVCISAARGWMSPDQWLDTNNRIVKVGGPEGIGLTPLLAQNPDFAATLLDLTESGEIARSLFSDCLSYLDFKANDVCSKVSEICKDADAAISFLAHIAERKSGLSHCEWQLLKTLEEHESAEVRELAFECSQYVQGYGPKPFTWGRGSTRHRASEEQAWAHMVTN